jgi:translation initiation factor IF-2
MILKRQRRVWRGVEAAVVRSCQDEPNQHAFEQPTEKIIYDVNVPENITVGDLAQQMAVKAGEVIKELMNLGVMATSTKC